MIPIWWVRLWGVAIVAHVVGNPRFGQLVPEPTALGVATFLCLIAGVLCILVPDRREVLVAGSVLVVTVAWLEAPYLSNHWQLAALVSLAVVMATVSGRGTDWLFPTGRWMLIGFYTWAAFAKLNEAFFDPEVSCGLVYANQALDSWGLAAIPPDSALAWLPVLGSAAIELSIPVLLLVRRTRSVGVVIGLVFHGLISLDLDQHFYDFTAVLIPLFLLFAPRLGEKLTGEWRMQMARPLVVVAGLIGLSGLLPLDEVSYGIVQYGVFVVWVPFLAWVWWNAVPAVWRMGEPVALRLPGISSAAVVGVVVVIGLLPYFEVRTATSWNMYANLHTVAGESNHLVIRSSMPITKHQEEVVEIVETGDEGLARYVDSGYGLVERQLLDYLADKPGIDAVVRSDGVERTVAGGNPTDRLGLVASKLQLFRAVDLTSPTRCQTVWLPAH